MVDPIAKVSRRWRRTRITDGVTPNCPGLASNAPCARGFDICAKGGIPRAKENRVCAKRNVVCTNGNVPRAKGRMARATGNAPCALATTPCDPGRLPVNRVAPQIRRFLGIKFLRSGCEFFARWLSMRLLTDPQRLMDFGQKFPKNNDGRQESFLMFRLRF